MIKTPATMIDKLLDVKRANMPRKGVSTGFASLDAQMLLNKQHLFLLTGYPSMGKSAFLNALSVNTALLHNWRWLYFSPENDQFHTHLQKIIQCRAGKKLIEMTDIEIENAAEWATKHFAWLDPGDKFYSLDDVMAATEKEIVVNGAQLDVIVIDPWNELCHSKQTNRDDVYISQELLKLRKFHKKYDLLSLIVIHPHSVQKDKDGNFPIPALRDCAGGAMWWNKADYGVCVHRTDMLKNSPDILIQKVKDEDIGRVGRISLDYEPGSGRFKDKYTDCFTVPEPLPF